MKSRLLFSLLIVVLALTASAQSSFPLFTTSEDIDIGNIKAAHLVHGDMWWNPASGAARCEFPKGSGKNVGFASSIWIGGYDAGNTLRVAAQTYRQKGTDYWPGPIDSNTTSQSYATSQKWAKIWKISRSQIDSFRSLGTHTAANTISAILEWPAIGNPYAKDANAAPLTITKPMAPFVDANMDGIYNPLAGDYPAIKGDQMLWWIINDNGPVPKLNSETNSMLIDIAISAYAYKRNTIADNIIFYEYLVTNHSTNAYTDTRLAVMADMDLGNATDDYIGFDFVRRLGVVYNALTTDMVYGNKIPVAGTVALELPGDVVNNYQPLGTFNTYTNGAGSNGDPSNGIEFYHIMDGYSRTNVPIRNGTKYIVPSLRTYCDSMNAPGDMRYVMSTPTFSFAPATTKKIAFALVVADSSGGCPNINFQGISQTSDTAMKYYWNPPNSSSSTSISHQNISALQLYPNPATLSLYIVTGTTTGTAQVYDHIAHQMDVRQTYHDTKLELDISALPAGIYSIRYTCEGSTKTALFVKK